jgi:hypothetical protein
VFVALGIQHAVHMRRIVIFGLFGSTVLFHIISKMAKSLGGKKVTERKMCVLIFSTYFV